jgi:hypothetical protein
MKINDENFPFLLEKNMKIIIQYGVFKPKFWYKEFPHIYIICILKRTIKRSHENYQQPSCLRGFLFKFWFWFNKIKLVFHIPLDIIIRNNCWRSNKSFTFQTNFHFWDKLLDVFLKPTRVDVVNKWNLPWMRIEMKNWTCFGQGKSKNSDFIICIICFKPFALANQ